MKVEMKLRLNNPDSSMYAFTFMKGLEEYIYKKFTNVHNFSCVKKMHDDFVTLSFEHDGEITPEIELSDFEF